ncbi:MAG: hypothetical protein GY868_14290, partial [Deltaproteobacteria bacterium]|nr:hypothetical protein [Deltaproteobacteria bacterium]
GMQETAKTVNTCVILLEVEFDGETTVLGAQADAVREVIDLEPDQIEPAPKIGSKWKTEFIRGIGKRNEEFIILLDIDRIFSADEIAMVQGDSAPAGVVTSSNGLEEKDVSSNEGVELSL